MDSGHFPSWKDTSFPRHSLFFENARDGRKIFARKIKPALKMFPTLVHEEHKCFFRQGRSFSLELLSRGSQRSDLILETSMFSTSRFNFSRRAKIELSGPSSLDTSDILLVVFNDAPAQIVIFLIVFDIRVITNFVQDADCLFKFISQRTESPTDCACKAER